MVKLAARYVANRVSMAAQQDGYGAAVKVGARLLAAELRKIPRLVRLAAGSKGTVPDHPVGYSDAIRESLEQLPVDFRPFRVDVGRFEAHLNAFSYPRAYAAGSLEEGGNRDNKLLEYFFTLETLEIHPRDVVIDVASEYSVFPTVVRQLRGATAFRQDLIYPDGIDGDRIGGNAAAMPVRDEFADVLVLHNSFEHFEGAADSEFVTESWRILRPGGAVMIVPLFVSDEYSIVTDPLTDRTGIQWDPGARILEIPGRHNRFGRFYSAAALEERVLSPARRVGYEVELLHFVNIKDVHPRASVYFALVMRKPRSPVTVLPGDSAGRTGGT